MPRPKRRKPMSDSQRLEQLQAFVELCLFALDCDSDDELAIKIGCCCSTARRLNMGLFTTYMRTGTLMRLSDAAGFRLEMTKYDARIALAG